VYKRQRPYVPYATQWEESMHGAPFILPDTVVERQSGSLGTRLAHVEMKRDQYLQLKKKSGTNRAGCREYVPGHLVTNVPQKALVLDARNQANNKLVIPVQSADTNGQVTGGNCAEPNRWRIKIMMCEDEELLEGIVSLGNGLYMRMGGKGNARTKSANKAGMWGMRSRDSTGNIQYVTLEEGSADNPSTKEELSHTKATATRLFRQYAHWMQANGLRKTLEKMRRLKRETGSTPPKSLGGSQGVVSTANLSFVLGNESHFDPSDLGEGMSIWVDNMGDKANNWFLCFPNMQVEYDQKIYWGLCIRLFHGAVVIWDGRVLKHCSLIPKLTNGHHHVYGCFMSPCRRCVPKTTPRKFARQPNHTQCPTTALATGLVP